MSMCRLFEDRGESVCSFCPLSVITCMSQTCRAVGNLTTDVYSTVHVIGLLHAVNDN